ncbi:MAG: hypothetical protein AAFU60_10525, partial [Bacteroidota bacterium]
MMRSDQKDSPFSSLHPPFKKGIHLSSFITDPSRKDSLGTPFVLQEVDIIFAVDNIPRLVFINYVKPDTMNALVML